MPKYMVELAHTPDECIAGFGPPDQRDQDFLGDIYWGCTSGTHRGWVVIDADSEQQAREQVPENIRKDVTITEVEVEHPDLVNAIDPNAANPGRSEPFWS